LRRFISLRLAPYLLRITSISMTFVWLGVGTLVLAPLLAQLLPKPAGTAGGGSIRHEAAAAPGESDWLEMLRTGQFYQLWLLMVLSVSAV